MIFGDGIHGVSFGSPLSAPNLTTAIANSTTGELKTFNEPNISNQSNLTPAQAAALWPQIRATGLRIGSPASGDRTNGDNMLAPNSWMRQFMALIGNDVDFIDTHLYMENLTAPEVAYVQAYLMQVHALFNKPIWLTETAVINFNGGASNPTDAVVESAMLQLGTVLRDLPYVERVAWYRIGPGRDAPASSWTNFGLNNTDGTTDTLGTYFKGVWLP